MPEHPPEADDLLPTDLSHPTVDEGPPSSIASPGPPWRGGDSFCPTWESGLAFPWVAWLAAERKAGRHAAAGQELDATEPSSGNTSGRTTFFSAYPPSKRPGEARHDPGLFPEQRRPTRTWSGTSPWGRRHRTGRGVATWEVEPPGDRQIPGRLAVAREQGPEADPVVSPNGGGPVGAASGVLMEGACAPDMFAGAMNLGAINGRDSVAVPDPAGRPRRWVWRG